ncbi:MAG: hypothetical protein WDN67_02760 [Candidatus Moraniibacteriota bacterium]
MSVGGISGSDEIIVSDSGTPKRITYDNLFGNVLGSLNYQGTWNANTDTPSLSGACSSGSKGHYYVVEVTGSTDLDGNDTWNIGDWAVCNGSGWQRVQTASGVSSVFGRGGAVTAQSGDYSANLITNATSGSISSATVQEAINELDSEN